MADSGLVYISGADWPAFKAQMDKLKDVAAMASDKTLAFIGAEGRRVIGKDEQAAGLEFGKTYTKWKGRNESETKIRTRFVPSHGWYKASDGRRMIGFSFENALGYQGKTAKKIGRMSVGYVYSLMANLWNNPTKPYSKPSAPFQLEGSDRRGGWAKGQRRPAMRGLTTGAVQEAVTPAMRRATEALEKMIVAEGLG